MFKYDNRVVVITGASSGLGRQMAFALAESGANVVLLARRIERLEEIKKEYVSLVKEIRKYYHNDILVIGYYENDDPLINQGIKNGDLIEITNTGMIHFSIKNLTGKTIKIETPPNISVKLLKYFILIKEGYPISEQILVFDGKQLENSKSIAEYGIQNESTLTLVLSLRG